MFPGAGTSNTILSNDLAGRENLIAGAPATQAGWVVILSEPTSSAFAQPDGLTRTAVLLTLVGLLAALGKSLARDRLLLAFLGNHEDGGEVDEDPRATEQREDDKPEPVERRAEVEVPAKAGADTGDPPAGRGALEARRA